ncbi:zinc-ribbon domain-containing protein [Desulfolutivibrio sulfoxidireducens]|uniref:zinc-ribbon domain-containing protein n=1 Tax=Desulfolutivibrio sulfoxidireducens TaxID=2773299 RepID=UPI00159D2043|nr:zinc ribbon domain-containing protein [Desulfolutivibrio sulfoxidireducens]QLA14932.1 zinc-ribbon domain-containing protein [Desulfolutivibrio sulfoxidireducens]QLA18499.1 zinc-ribbon domain-containing protein [Desulfolutivibrio sulfoxidireducens]
MICNKCGAENDNDQRFCAVCGHKLRSRERLAEPDPAKSPDQDGSVSGDGPGAGGAREAGEGSGTPDDAGAGVFLEPLAMGRLPSFGGLAFAWALALLLAGAALWSAFTGISWPLYPLTAIVALLAWLRGL